MRPVLKALILGHDLGEVSTIEDEGRSRKLAVPWQQMPASVAPSRP